jgi:16S rRNA (guanine527-N7)-methyltransferase
VTAEGPAAVLEVADVSRETLDRIAVFLALVRRWNAAENLVAPGEVHALWTRHCSDSAQLPALVPEVPGAPRRWIDIGSGAGFPGIVIALTSPPGTHVDLIESNRRKCAFLRQAIRETGAPATVHPGRAEALLPAWPRPADIVTARAVAPLDRLLTLAAPVLARGARGLFPKGREHQTEIDEAALAWEFDLVKHPSRIDPDGVILELTNVRPRAGAARKR